MNSVLGLHGVTRRPRPWLVTLAALAWSANIHAEALAFELHWEAPAECPHVDEVRNGVLRLVAPRTQFSSPIIASARVELNDERKFVLKLETIQAGVEGERFFAGRTCRAVTDAAIVTMALSLDPNIEIPSSPKRAMPEVPAPLPLSPPVVGPAPTKSTAQSSVVLRPLAGSPRIQFVPADPGPRIHGYLRSLVGWRWGSLPESSGELGLSFGLRRARLSSQVSLSASPLDRSAYSRELPNAGGTFSMQALEWTACWSMVDGRWRVAPCLGLAFTHVAARGVGVSPMREGRLYWMSPQLALEGSYQLGRVIAFYLRGAGYVAFRQPEAYLGESERIFRPGAVAYQVAGGGELQMW